MYLGCRKMDHHQDEQPLANTESKANIHQKEWEAEWIEFLMKISETATVCKY